MQSFEKAFGYKIIILAISLGLTVSSSAANLNSTAAAEKSLNNLLELKKQAELGDPLDQFFVASEYDRGSSITEQSDANALYWYQRAANQDANNIAYAFNKISSKVGVLLSQEKLGLIYSEGKGVRQDYATAAKWYQKAAENGLSSSQFTLGLIYSEGKGVRQDYATAAKWYQKAAEQSNPSAKNNLGLLYEKGQGVRQNKSEAKELYGQACDSGIQLSCDNYRKLNEQGY